MKTTNNAISLGKKIAIGILFFSISQSAIAQTATSSTKTMVASSAFEKIMAEKITKLENSHDIEVYTTLANDFARIAEKEKSQWLPYYYTALANLQKGRMLMQNREKLSELDVIADQADKSIAKADELSPMNSEIYVLKKMSHGIRMMVNPQQRYMTEGAEAQKALAMAKTLNANNPRILLLEAEDTYYTPEQFGGSKTKGLALFQKAQESFQTFKPKSTLDPNWGKNEVEYFLSQKK